MALMASKGDNLSSFPKGMSSIPLRGRYSLFGMEQLTFNDYTGIESAKLDQRTQSKYHCQLP